jgi:hypothetical protein
MEPRKRARNAGEEGQANEAAAPRSSSSSSSSSSASSSAPPFRGPAADSALGERLIDVIGIVAAVGFACEASHCLYLCGETYRKGDKGATNDMLAQSQRLQCGAREARAAKREYFVFSRGPKGEDDDDDEEDIIEGSTALIRAAALNNLPRVLQLVQLGAPLDVFDEDFLGRSALHWASELGHEHVAKALLDGKYERCGAKVDLRTKTNSLDTCEAVLRTHGAPE